MSWWESAYRSGRVNWDPGEYDGHLPWFLDAYAIGSGRVLDPGCGNGKSAVWLAERGFEVVGVDLSPTAIEQARRRASRHGVAERTSFHEGHFPDGLPPLTITGTTAGADVPPRAGGSDGGPDRASQTPNSFDLITERAFLQHLGRGRPLKTTVDLLSRMLKPSGLFYSLMIAAEGAAGYWGIVKWSQAEIRSALEPRFEILEMWRDVFTPGEPGSVSAWITVSRTK